MQRRNPIVISDDEGGDVIRVSPRSGKGSPRLSSKGAGVSQAEKNVHSLNPKKSNARAHGGGASRAGASSEVGEKKVGGSQPVSRDHSALVSRNDLYYDEKDRGELASWTEFPREVELNRRHELVVRNRLRSELLGSDRDADPVGSLLLPAVQSPKRGRLVRRLEENSDDESEKGQDAFVRVS